MSDVQANEQEIRKAVSNAKKVIALPDDPPGLAEMVEQMNEKYFVVLSGSSVRVGYETVDSRGNAVVTLMSFRAFKDWVANKGLWTKVEKPDGKSGAVKEKPLFLPYARCLNHNARREYDGIDFNPEFTPKGFFNLWRGFALEPDQEAFQNEKHMPFLEHLRDNVCAGDGMLFEWVEAWFANLFQKPARKPGTSLVFRGNQGTGKTIVGQIIGTLLGSHYALVDDPRYLTGQFNAHLESCLLLQVDEGFWGGDRAAEGHLKGLITAQTQFIERKGMDPVQVSNHLRVMMSSNNHWVVPAGFEERRFCVLDVAPTRQQDERYFGAMVAAMEEGGYGALLWHFLHYVNLDSASGPNLSRPPPTKGLLDQKLNSLSPEQTWWYESLMHGRLQHSEYSFWSRQVLCQDFVRAYQKYGHFNKRYIKSTKGLMGELDRLLPRDFKRRRMSGEGGNRNYYYLVPDLDACREAFACALDSSVEELGFVVSDE